MPTPKIDRCVAWVKRCGWSGSFLATIGSILLGNALLPNAIAETDSAYRSSISPGEWASASFPVEDFQAYTSAFGYRGGVMGGGSEFHAGLDLAAPEGSYIRNWWSGTVVETIDDDRCGTGLVIKSGDWEHVYCHMQGYVETINGVRTLVDRDGGVVIEQGQQIPTSARIGRVGMTGRTTGPHLHWGLVYQDEWVDPATVIRAMAG
jgi:murein DD-endopeptidase MepM/ murein hydrolase activator NlpD